MNSNGNFLSKHLNFNTPYTILHDGGVRMIGIKENSISHYH